MSKSSYVVYPAKIANQLVRKYQKEIKDIRKFVDNSYFIVRNVLDEKIEVVRKDKILEILDKEKRK